MTDSASWTSSGSRRVVRFDPTRPRGPADYVRAHRHSRRVRFLKYALPTIAVLSIGGFILSMRFADITGAALVALTGLNIDKKTLVMDAPHMSGYDASHHPYQVKAVKATQDLTSPKVVTLDTVDAHFASDDDSTVNVKAKTGVFDGYKNTLALSGGIAVETSDGYHATLEDAAVDIGKGDIVSQKPVEIHSSDGWLKANGVLVNNHGAKVTFVNGVTVNFVPPEEDKTAQSGAADKPAGANGGGAPDSGAGAKPDDRAADSAATRGKSKPGSVPATDKPSASAARDSATAAAERLKSITE